MTKKELKEKIKHMNDDADIIILADDGYVKSTIHEICEYNSFIYMNIDINSKLEDILI